MRVVLAIVGNKLLGMGKQFAEACSERLPLGERTRERFPATLLLQRSLNADH
jgi:hypothetical protein